MQRRCAQRSNGMSHGARCLCWARAPSPVAALRDSVLRLPTDILSLLSITPHPPPAYLPSVTRYRQSIKPPPPPPPPSPTSVPPRTRPFKATAHFIRQAGGRALRHTFAQPHPKRERERERERLLLGTSPRILLGRREDIARLHNGGCARKCSQYPRAFLRHTLHNFESLRRLPLALRPLFLPPTPVMPPIYHASYPSFAPASPHPHGTAMHAAPSEILSNNLPPAVLPPPAISRSASQRCVHTRRLRGQTCFVPLCVRVCMCVCSVCVSACTFASVFVCLCMGSFVVCRQTCVMCVCVVGWACICACICAHLCAYMRT